MLAIPAIDLYGGRCVRLEQGDYTKVTDYGGDPIAVTASFCAAGAQRVHLVDLDAARGDGRRHAGTIRAAAAVAAEYGATVQAGGGIRTLADLDEVIAAGAALAIMGTAAVRDTELLARACARHPGRVMIGLDARRGKLAVQGWTEDTAVDAVAKAREADAAGCAGIVFTDIARDGTLRGSNAEATAEMAAAVTCPVYASGGIAEVAELDILAAAGAAGAIIGKALHAGRIRIEDALARTAQLGGK